MDRKDFLRTSCIACMGMAVGASILPGCAGAKYAKAAREENGLLVDLSTFTSGKRSANRYVIVRDELLQYPVCIYDLGGGQYSALLMQCSHQGAELTVSGDQLTCSAHGSSFDKMGKATHKPASKPLRTFPVTVTRGKLFIDLRKQT